MVIYVQISAPMEDEFSAITLPLPEGEYLATYSESSLSQNNCAGDQSSTATISGNTLTLHLCLNSDTYRKWAGIIGICIIMDEIISSVVILSY